MLYPCESCKRYIRNDEASCPFCSAVGTAPEITGEAPRGLSRREMVALAAAAVAGSGCPKKPPNMPYGCAWVDPDESVEV